MSIRENLRVLMDKNDITQMRLAEIAGVEPATVSGWMNEKSDPRRYYLEKIADYFNVSVDDLRSEGHGLAAKQRGSYITPVPVDSYAPVIGYVPAGDPYEATEIEGELHWVDPDVRSKHPKAFFLIISGDSMDKVFDDGRYVLIDPDGDPHDKDIVAVIVNGDEATIKRIFFAGDVIVLHPDSTNGKHKARTIDVSNPDAPPVRILGVAVWDVPAKSGPYR